MSEYGVSNSGFAINSSLRRLFTASRCTEFHHVLNRELVQNFGDKAVVGLLSPRDFGPIPTSVGFITNESSSSTHSETGKEPVIEKTIGEPYFIAVSHSPAFTKVA